MQAIKAGAVGVDSIPVVDIDYHNYASFQVQNGRTMNSQQIDAQRQSAWSQLKGEAGNPKINWIAQLAGLHNQHFMVSENGSSPAVDVLDRDLPEDCTIWEAYSDFDLVPDSLRDPIRNYVRAVKANVFQNPNFKKIPHNQSLVKAFRKMRSRLHLISEDDFRSWYVPSHNAERHLQTSLGVIFTKYVCNKLLWAISEWHSRGSAISVEELYAEYENAHTKPWEVINEILQQIHLFSQKEGVFNFEVTYPNDQDVSPTDWQSYSFNPVLLEKADRTQRQFAALSSGEQTLLALAISIYESRDDFSFPELLLLDEVDASLHPSMSRAMIHTLINVFAKNGTKVILATHSPSTVALAPKESVFVVHKGRVTKKLEHQSQAEALHLLTEGYMTLEEGIPVLNQIATHDISIFSEGRNHTYLKRALELFGVKDVGVVDCMNAVTGKDQLATLFQLLSAAPISVPMLFIWDVDAPNNLPESDYAFKMTLPRNTSNKVCKKGIENMFPEHFFDGFVSEYKPSKGDVQKKFDSTRKGEFERHLLANAQSEDFALFQSVIDKLDEVRRKVAAPNGSSSV